MVEVNGTGDGTKPRLWTMDWIIVLVWRNVPFVIVMALYVHQCALLRLITMLISHVYVQWSQILLLQP